MKILNTLLRLLPHLLLIFSLMLITFFCIDLVNESMAFLNNRTTKILVAVFSALCAVHSVFTIIKNQK